MNEHVDVMCQVRESFSGLHMDMPVEKVLARSRTRRHHRLLGLTATAAGAAGAAAMTLTLGGHAAPAHSGYPPQVSPSSVRLAAFSVTSGPGGSTTLVLRRGPQYRLDPSALRRDLAQHRIPALVTVGTFCRSMPGARANFRQIVHASKLADGSDVMVINGSAMPPGTRLSIGYGQGWIWMAVIADHAPLSCSSPLHRAAAHITPSGTPIRG